LRREVVEHRLSFAGKLHEGLHVVDALRYLTVKIETLFEAGALLKNFAGTVLVGPEVGFGNLLLQVVEQLLLNASVKETSGLPRLVILVL
jgi:hypothetical protein